MAINKTIEHRYRHRRVVILRNSSKDIICYVLQSYTPRYKRVLDSVTTNNRDSVKEFLDLV